MQILCWIDRLWIRATDGANSHPKPWQNLWVLLRISAADPQHGRRHGLIAVMSYLGFD